MRKESVPGTVNTDGKISIQGVDICLLKMILLLLQTDQEESRVQVNGFYLRSGRNIDSVLKIKVKRLSSQNWMERDFKCPV